MRAENHSHILTIHEDLTAKINKKLEYNKSIKQAGFRKGYSTEDHLLTIRALIEEVIEHIIHLYLLPIDYEKVFSRSSTGRMKTAYKTAELIPST